jgi:Ca2+/H+ antiporter, TMEM165/GDT1 family
VHSKKILPAELDFGMSIRIPYVLIFVSFIICGTNLTSPEQLVTLTSKSGFVPAFISSFLLILGSEIGDKTFFIAAILSMKHSHIVVFAGAIMALILMTILSAGLGLLLPSLLSKELTHYTCTALFVYFGVRLLYDVYTSEDDGSENEELKEVEMELQGPSPTAAMETVTDSSPSNTPSKHRIHSWLTSTESGRVFVQAFVMTFLAEWGDRSQIATIALASSQNAVGVTLGGFVGHSLCTGVAVIGGKLLASRISERHVNLAGGCLFLLFALMSIVMGVE